MTAAQAACLLSLLGVPAWAEPPGIYGEDDRKEVYEATAGQQKSAKSVVALFDKSQVKLDAARKTAILVTERYTVGSGLTTGRGGRKYVDHKLAKGTRYFGKPAGAYCSGVLVAKNVVLTAGHCSVHCPGNDPSYEEETYFVFGFALESAEADPTRVSARDVYGCVGTVGKHHAVEGDWRLVQLDREVEGREPIAFQKTPELKVGEALMTIGHPEGLSAKVAAGAKLRERVSAESAFYGADLDVFSGNSGGPVFDSQNRVVGTVSTGYESYAYDEKKKKLVLRAYTNESKQLTTFSSISDETVKAYNDMTKPSAPLAGKKMEPVDLHVDEVRSAIQKAWEGSP